MTNLKPDGSGLVYSTYLGGSGDDKGDGIAVDSSGSAYITGDTNSTNLPTANALQSSNAGGDDAFVAKLKPDGSGLVYSTYLGGSGTDVATTSQWMPQAVLQVDVRRQDSAAYQL